MKNSKVYLPGILFLMLVLNICQSYAAEYYVNSITGDDSNPGTSINQPWKTFGPVNSGNFKPGDIIQFACGSEWNEALNISGNGTEDNPIIYKSYGQGDKPLISTPSPVKHDYDYYKTLPQYQEMSIPAVNITGTYNIFDGFLVRDAPFAAIELVKGADHNMIRNCEITNSGMGVSSHSMYNLFTRNYVHDLFMIRDTPAEVNKDDDYGAVAFWMWTDNNEISYNRAVNCEQHSYDYILDGGFVELLNAGSNTYIHHNWVERCNGFVEAGSSENVTIAYNVSLESSDIFIFLHIYVRKNGTANIRNWKVDNNTVIRRYGRVRPSLINFGNVFTPPPEGTLYLRNNIFVLGGGPDVVHNIAPTGDFVHENNIYQILPRAEVGYKLGPNEVIADPGFVNEAGKDFSLTDKSPAKGAGLNLGYTENFSGQKLPAGKKPDIGAY